MADITSNLDLYYKWDSSDATDSSGNSRNGTVVGSPSYATGKIGSKAISLNGTSQYVTAPYTGAFAGYNVTIATWAKFNSLDAGDDNMMMQRDNDATDWGIGLATYGTSARAQVVVYGSAYSLNSATTLSTGTWYHIATTYDGVNLRLYINNVEDANSPLTIGGPLRGSGNQLTIGGLGLSGGRYVNGYMDETRYYSRTLTSADITELYNYTDTVALDSSFLFLMV